MSTPIKVMTFNMRISTPVDGDNWFRNRKPKIAEVIRRENPDIIGFQEVNEEMQDFLTETFPEYIILGHGRKENYSWEGTPIAFRKSRFLLHTFRERWLSLEEDLPGSRLHGMGQSDCPRVLICAELIDRTNYKPFSFYNGYLFISFLWYRTLFFPLQYLCNTVFWDWGVFWNSRVHPQRVPMHLQICRILSRVFLRFRAR